MIVGFFWLVSPAFAAKTCYDCHEEAKEKYSKFRFEHKPVKDEDCESCHKRHGFAQQLILKDVTSQLCYECHVDLKDQYGKGEVHFPVSSGKCWDCHNPHGSDSKGMIRALPAEGDWASFCQLCHGDLVTENLQKSVVHAPFAGVECLSCHVPHNSVHGGLLVAEVNTLCGECHDVSTAEWQSTHREKHAIGLPCSDCHTAHASDTKGLLDEATHDPFAGGECELCHTLPDTSGTVVFEEGTGAGEVCGACHDDIVEMTSSKYPHAAVEADNCDNCHNSHSSRFGSLLKADQNTLCGECHEGVLTGTGKTPHMPAVTGECGSCHEVHGSDRASLVKADDAGLCLGCHTDFATAQDAARLIHAAVDDCLGCHDPHEGVQAGILKKESTQLCADCHSVDAQALTARSGHQPYLTGNCADCHVPHFSQTAHLVRESGIDMCGGCHVDVAKRLEMAVPHAAAADDCQGCHAPHYSDNLHLLTSTSGELCASCHDYEELNLTKSYVHTAASTGDCTGCHNPHGGNEAKLVTGRITKIDVGGLKVGQLPKLTGITSDLCYTCHEDLAEEFRRQNTHAPVAEGSCDACHAAHGSEYPGFVIADGPELCGSCHDLDQALSASHGGYDISNADCLDCHNPHVSDNANLVRNVSHQPFSDQSCENCHEKSADNKVSLIAGIGDLCSACHESVAEGLAMTHVHGPFAGEDCGGCHRLHAADGESLLKAEGALLCVSCHEDVDDAAELPVLHDPFARGECLNCHQPHASAYAGLITKPGESFCYGCHEELKAEIEAGEPHAPVAGGECGSCHQPHASSYQALLSGAKLELCGECHDVTDRALRTAHKGFSLEGVDCQNCHAAHAGPTGSTGLLLPDKHAPFAEGECTTCHEGLQPHKLVASGNQLCTTCHEDFLEGAAGAVVHEALRQEAGCASCHGPHVGYGSALQLKKGTQTCFTCHDDDGFKGMNKHAIAFEDCSNCHQPHTSPYKGLLTASSVMELCTSCHEDATETHYHPMGAGVTDPRTKAPLNCVGCHSPHSSDYTAILVAEKDRKLCIICHTVSH